MNKSKDIFIFLFQTTETPVTTLVEKKKVKSNVRVTTLVYIPMHVGDDLHF